MCYLIYGQVNMYFITPAKDNLRSVYFGCANSCLCFQFLTSHEIWTVTLATDQVVCLSGMYRETCLSRPVIFIPMTVPRLCFFCGSFLVFVFVLAILSCLYLSKTLLLVKCYPIAAPTLLRGCSQSDGSLHDRFKEI